MTEDSHAFLLHLLSQGLDVAAVVREHPDYTHEDVAAAAAAGLAALSGPRVESRAERIARLQQTHPRAYASWTEDEDARLVQRWHDGAKVAELARELGRQPGAIRQRLERHLGPAWRERGLAAGSL